MANCLASFKQTKRPGGIRARGAVRYRGRRQIACITRARDKSAPPSTSASDYIRRNITVGRPHSGVHPPAPRRAPLTDPETDEKYLAR
ncbi:hypothetical protein EVAR_82736_1 [Eumeta japonica]|uniref:Uncharacterized protein n=1 Tax=Eumeta variegata TaxID=151549 RepID=A0A4C1ZP05_EUMVA|nr:hypothetical protein EVAR_82736_1 [Eumeta japonica]